MKRSLSLLACSLFLSVVTVQAQDIRAALSVSFCDAFGYTWEFPTVHKSGNIYKAVGTMTGAYPTAKALFYADASGGRNNIYVEFHAINTSADNCTTYSDSFVYVGTAVLSGGGYTASGTWSSYCFGGVINVGTWSGSGPCTGPKITIDPKMVTPAKANHDAKFSANTSQTEAIRAALAVSFCDAFGYTWQFPHVQSGPGHTYRAQGTMTGAYPTAKALFYADASGGRNNVYVEFHAINTSADNCTTYSDSFVYVGTAVVSNGGYTASGTWSSYCFGGVINVGTWSGSGPCTGPKITIDPNMVAPGKANHDVNGFSVIISPNPVKNLGQIQYKVGIASKVNITIYDYMHRPVKELVNESKAPGKYTINWNAINASGTKVQPGLYRLVSTVNGKVYSQIIQVM
jgi:hypothetical protein